MRAATFAAALAFPVTAAVMSVAAPPPAVGSKAAHAVSAAVRALAARSGDSDLRDFYLARDHRLLWISDGALRPQAHRLLDLLESADQDGLNPTKYGLPGLRAQVAEARRGGFAALAKAEFALSRAYADYASDLHRPAPHAQMIFTDPALGPIRLTRRGALEGALSAPSLDAQLQAVRRMNPIYEGLRRSLASYRTSWSQLPQVRVAPGEDLAPGAQGERVADLRRRLGLPGRGDRYDAALRRAVLRFQGAHGLAPTGRADAATVAALNAGPQVHEARLLANLERARALPRDLGERFILVDAASATLWLYEGDRIAKTMRVIVGKPDQQTPMMAGMIRYAVFNPVWNVPEDLVRTRIAPAVLSDGLGYMQAKRMQIMSDWSDEAIEVDPAKVDWTAVAAGRRALRVRQRPGHDNMMGMVKLMLPNDLGIYLHDTPDKAAFTTSPRLLSSGCVRLEDARSVSAWLLNGKIPSIGSGDVEHRIDLRRPTPVYITYFTALPSDSGVRLHTDVYGRDHAFLARSSRAHS